MPQTIVSCWNSTSPGTDVSGEPAGSVNVVLKNALGRTSRGAGSFEKMKPTLVRSVVGLPFGV